MDDYNWGFDDGYDAALWGNDENPDPCHYLDNKSPVNDEGAYYKGFLEGARQARQVRQAN